MNTPWRFNTQAIHSEQSPEKDTGAISQSVIPAVAYSFPNADAAVDVVSGRKEGTYYGRYGNPTTRTLEKKISVLENAEDALGVSSGMAAISIALLAFLKQGDHVVVTKDVYGGTHKFLTSLAPRFGITYDFVDCNHLDELKNAIKEN